MALTPVEMGPLGLRAQNGVSCSNLGSEVSRTLLCLLSGAMLQSPSPAMVEGPRTAQVAVYAGGVWDPRDLL